MEIKINFFAALRDSTGKSEIKLPWQQGMTSFDVVLQLKEIFHPLAALLDSSFVAVNGNYAGRGVVLNPGDVVALLPPVSGG